MPVDDVDARLLLQVPPDQYIAERTRLVKEAKAAKDRERAAFFQGLKRPNLALWAVLAAGEDADGVQAAVAATTGLGDVQGRGGDRGAVSKATEDRRQALQHLVDRAAKALATSQTVTEQRRAEIRGIIDQLSRQPEVAESWIEGTLRDLPEDSFGFGAFAGVEVSGSGASTESKAPKASAASAASAAPARSAKPTRSSKPDTPAKPSKPAPSKPTIDLKAEREARGQVADAEREVAVAKRRLATAGDAAAKAAAELQARQVDHDAAVEGLEQAKDRLRRLGSG